MQSPSYISILWAASVSTLFSIRKYGLDALSWMIGKIAIWMFMGSMRPISRPKNVISHVDGNIVEISFINCNMFGDCDCDYNNRITIFVPSNKIVSHHGSTQFHNGTACPLIEDWYMIIPTDDKYTTVTKVRLDWDFVFPIKKENGTCKSLWNVTLPGKDISRPSGMFFDCTPLDFGHDEVVAYNSKGDIMKTFVFDETIDVQ